MSEDNVTKTFPARDEENDDRLELTAVRYFKGKVRPGFGVNAYWDGSEQAIDGISAFLGLAVGPAMKNMQEAKEAQQSGK